MTMGRRESVRGVLQLYTDNGFPRSVGEFVVEDDVEALSWTTAADVSGCCNGRASTVTYILPSLGSILTIDL